VRREGEGDVEEKASLHTLSLYNSPYDKYVLRLFENNGKIIHNNLLDNLR
jgi:hypothetical protein